MATDATEREGSLKQTDTNLPVGKKSSGESDTPRGSATLKNKSSRVAERGSDDQAVTEPGAPTEAMTSAGNGDQAVSSSPKQTEGGQEESSHKGKKQEATRTASSAPVSVQPSAQEHNGR